jgi:hypothetical protein
MIGNSRKILLFVSSSTSVLDKAVLNERWWPGHCKFTCNETCALLFDLNFGHNNVIIINYKFKEKSFGL